jgi:hypothetical protein
MIARNEHVQALELLDKFVPSNLPAITLGQRQSWTARVELALAKHQAEQAEDILDHLIRSAPKLKEGIVIPRLWMLRARALLEQGRTAEAESVALAARERLMKQPQPRLLWRIDALLAAIYARQNRQADAAKLRAEAGEITRALGASLGDTALAQKFVERATKMIDDVKVQAASQE